MANGGIIGKTNAATSEAASGVWSLNEAFLAISETNWPGTVITLHYLVVAGGGGGGFDGGGGGAGGYRTTYGLALIHI